MRSLLAVAATALLFSMSAQAQDVWVRSLASTGKDHCRGVAARGGFVYTIGSFSGTMTAEGQTITPVGGTDVYIAKYTSGGDLVWLQRAGSEADDYGYGIAVDSEGNIAVCGEAAINSNITIGDTTMFTSGAFVAKFNSGGGLLWARGVTGSGYSEAIALTVDEVGNIYITGQYNGNDIKFGDKELKPRGTYDVFVARYSSGGTPQWAASCGSEKLDVGFNIAVSGNALYVIGSIGGGATFGSHSVPGAGNTDAFLVKFNAATGGVQWAVTAGGVGPDLANGLTVDGQHVYVSGSFAAKAGFGDIELQAVGQKDGFLACYKDDGTINWVKQIAATGRAFAADVAAVAGNVVITGEFAGTATFDDAGLISGGPQDAFIARYTADGEFIDVIQAGMGTRPTTMYAVDASPDDGSIAFAGMNEEAMSIGDTVLYNIGDVDCFVGRIANFTTSVAERDNHSFAVAYVHSALHFSFAVDRPQRVLVMVSDVAGRSVYSSDLGTLPAGAHSMAAPMPLPASGTYIATVKIDGHALSRPIFVAH